jgi:beta-glucosidase
VWLKAGDRRRVSFTVEAAEALSGYDTARKSFVVDPGEYQIQVGASSKDIRLEGSVRVR